MTFQVGCYQENPIETAVPYLGFQFDRDWLIQNTATFLILKGFIF